MNVHEVKKVKCFSTDTIFEDYEGGGESLYLGIQGVSRL